MRALFVAMVAFVTLVVPSARAQDEEEPAAVEAPDAERAAPEVVEAWAIPDEATARSAEDDEKESTAWARIHDADADLLEQQAVEQMIGFDVLDGVR